MALTHEQRDRIARIVSDKNAYIDIGRYDGEGRFDDEEWLDLVQDFASATAEVAGPTGLDVIARRIAALDTPFDDESCHFCGVYRWLPGIEAIEAPIGEHEDECPWRLAVEWVSAAELPAGSS